MSKAKSAVTLRALRTFDQMFANRAGGRIVGIKYLRDGKVARYNGRVKSQSPTTVVITDNNLKR